MSLAVKLSVLLFKLLQEYIGTSSAVALFSVTIAKNQYRQIKVYQTNFTFSITMNTCE